MKKVCKILVIIILSLIFYLFIDLNCIFFFKRPFLVIKVESESKYKGIFFDIYDCPEYPMVQIKSKFTKFSCATSKFIIKEIVDTTKEMDGFACAEAFEEFYADEDYKYYYECMKSKYVIVRYENGFEETASEALKHSRINIEDLDAYDIKYYKYDK